MRLKLEQVSKTKKEIFAAMQERGIILNLHYIPVHLQPYYQRMGFKMGDYPAAEQYYREALTLPLYYDLTDDEQQYISECLHGILLDQ